MKRYVVENQHLSAYAEDHAYVPYPTSACRHGLCPWGSILRSFYVLKHGLEGTLLKDLKIVGGINGMMSIRLKTGGKYFKSANLESIFRNDMKKLLYSN